MSFAAWVGDTPSYKETKEILADWIAYHGWQPLSQGSKPFWFMGGSAIVNGTEPNDIDYFIFSTDIPLLERELELEGFTASEGENYEARGFRSLRRDKDNLILMSSPREFYAYFRASNITRDLEVTDRETRVYLYETLVSVVHSTTDMQQDGVYFINEPSF